VQHRVNRGDTFQMGGDQLAGRNPAFADQAGLFASGESQNVDQVSFSRNRGITP
jgi:hypothetical protein